jgi:hypothetical protein
MYCESAEVLGIPNMHYPPWDLYETRMVSYFWYEICFRCSELIKASTVCPGEETF